MSSAPINLNYSFLSPDPAHEVFPLPDSVTNLKTPDPFWSGSVGVDVPIVIDFGSCHVRAGFANQSDPFLDFPTIYARYRPSTLSSGSTSILGIPSSGDDEVGTTTAVGNDTLHLPPATRKSSPFDLNVPYHQAGVEFLLDHTFFHMINNNRPGEVEQEAQPPKLKRYAPCARATTGGGGRVGQSRSHAASKYYDGSVCHPVVMTEAPLIPRHSRGQLLQLLFECYNVPSACLGIDALFALLYDHHQNYRGTRVTNCAKTHARAPTPYCHAPSRKKGAQPAYFDWTIGGKGLDSRDRAVGARLEYPETALVLSSGYECSHVLPVVGGRLDVQNVMRVSVGGHHSTELLNRAVQLKYPQHRAVWNRLAASSGLSLGYSVSEAIKEQHGVVALDYPEVLREFQAYEFAAPRRPGAGRGSRALTSPDSSDSPALAEGDPATPAAGDPAALIRYIQLPYEPSPIYTLTDEERAEREASRVQNATRIKEITRRRREEKMRECHLRLMALEELMAFRANLASAEDEAWRARLLQLDFEDSDVHTACLGGPRDRVEAEMRQAQRSLAKSLDDLVSHVLPSKVAWRSDEALADALRRSESELEAHFPPRSRADEELSEARLRAMATSRLHLRFEDRVSELRKASRGEDDEDQTPATSTDEFLPFHEESDKSRKNNSYLTTIVLDLSKDLALSCLDELQAQRHLILAQLRRTQATLSKSKAALAQLQQAESQQDQSSSRHGGPSHPSPCGVGTIANAIGSRSSRASKSRMLFVSQQQHDEVQDDDKFMEMMIKQSNTVHLLMTSKSNASDFNLISSASFSEYDQLSSHIQSLTSQCKDDRLLIDHIDDEILSRLEPAMLSRREAEQHQLSLGVDRFRYPEILFQPSIIGQSQQGILEALLTVLQRYANRNSSDYDNLRVSMLRCLYLTGGNCSWPGLSPRLFRSLIVDLPISWPQNKLVRVIQSSSPCLTAWKGAALFSSNDYNLDNYFLKRSLYEEEGCERIHDLLPRHFASNYTTP